jgi:hypothetical protein
MSRPERRPDLSVGPRRRRRGPWARLAIAGVALLGAAAGCGSGRSPSQVATGGTSTTTAAPATTRPATTRPATSTTVARQVVLPTAPNCGGGAFKPATLLIVCGSGTTVATGVTWRSWDVSGATGSGTVHLVVNGDQTASPATLRLDQAVDGPVGEQFSRLTVRWTTTSPDGKAEDVYQLQIPN